MLSQWHIGGVVSSYACTILVYGSESLLSDRAISRIVALAKAERPEAELHRVGPRELSDGRFLELAGGSLFASDTILVVEDAQSLPVDLVPQIIAVASERPDYLCLVLQHDGSVKNKGLVDKLKKIPVEVVETPALKLKNLPAFAMQEARSYRVSLDPAAAQTLVDAIGADAREVASAIAQLVKDAEGEPLTKELITKYFAGRSEISGFAVAEAVLNGKRTEAMEKLRWAIETGVPPVLLVSAIASSLRVMGKYLELSKSGLPRLEVAKRVGVPHWRLKDLQQEARAWTAGGIATSIKATARADQEVKGGSDPAFALENLVLIVTGARSR